MDSMKFMPHCVSRSIIFAAGLALPLSGGEVPAGKPTVFTEHLVKDGYSYSYGLAAADLDGDGDIDLTSSDTRNFKLYWFENDGRGGFKEHFIEDGDRLGVIGSITGDAIGRSSELDPIARGKLSNRWFTTPRLERHAIADVNGDAKPDVVVIENLFGDVYWYKNSGTPGRDAVWQRFTITRHTIPGAYDVALADLDKDGDLDVAVSTWRLSNKFVWLENPGDPEKSDNWKLHVIEENISEPRTVRVGDFNGDGRPDLLGTALTANLTVWYENPGDPRTKPWPRHVIDGTSAQPGHGMPADIDGDGDLDVVMALGMDVRTKAAGTREIVWYENVGQTGKGATWQKYVIAAEFDNAFETVAVDLNGDGRPDVAATSYASPHGGAVWFENPGSPFTQPWVRHELKTNWARANQIIAADLNSDGRPDLVAGTTGDKSEVRWWRNEGTVVKASDAGVRDIGPRRELFLDHYLIDRLDGVRLELGRPQPGGVAVTYDKSWEGVHSFYTTVIKDGDTFRMYYRGAQPPGQTHKDFRGYRYAVCYAESRDGIHWTKPGLGIVELEGSKANNVLMLDNQCLAPFLDTRPGVPAAERFKGNLLEEERFGAKRYGLIGYVSPDGIHWQRVREAPIVLPALPVHQTANYTATNVKAWSDVELRYVPTLANNFDSTTEMFWSEAENRYVLYARHSEGGRRSRTRATSEDFLNWAPQLLMTYSDTGTSVPSEQLYTSQVQPYFRAPHVYVSLAGRLMEGRRALSAEEAGEVDPAGGGVKDIADGVLQTSRAGSTRFDRTFREALVRPGPGAGNWVSRTNFPACGIVQTGPMEMSIYVQRHYSQKTAHLERLTLRLDGFASVHSTFLAGELLTHPLRFSGRELELNCATSAAGGIRVELQDADGNPIPGFTLADCIEIHADDIARVVRWKHGSSVARLAGQPVRLRFRMQDADLYSLRFREAP